MCLMRLAGNYKGWPKHLYKLSQYYSVTEQQRKTKNEQQVLYSNRSIDQYRWKSSCRKHTISTTRFLADGKYSKRNDVPLPITDT